MTYTTVQTILDYAAIAPFIVAAGLFLQYCWQRTADTPETQAPDQEIACQRLVRESHERPTPEAPEPVQAVTHVAEPKFDLDTVLPDPTVAAERDLCDGLIQACEEPDEDATAIAELLAIPASPRPMEIDDSKLPALAKLYGVPGSNKWSFKRKLRGLERQKVMDVIAA